MYFFRITELIFSINTKFKESKMKRRFDAVSGEYWLIFHQYILQSGIPRCIAVWKLISSEEDYIERI